MRSLRVRFFLARDWIFKHQKEIKIFGLLLVLIFILEFAFASHKSQKIQAHPAPLISTPSPTPSVSFTTYKRPILPKSNKYNIFLFGDSMTHALGPRGGIFTELILKEYPGIFFEVSNYARSENILDFMDQLDQPYQPAADTSFGPILLGKPDLIIIESFGYNPLSQFGIKGGVEKQTQVLTELMIKLTNHFPNTAIMLLATIAPDKRSYAKSVSHDSAEERWAQAEERIDYIDNHIKYARDHNIPIIDVYHESLDSQGDGNTKYINPDDNIHPSAEGLALIGRVMTRRIAEENIFPK